MHAEIKPFQITLRGTAVRLECDAHVVPGKRAKVEYRLVDSAAQPIATGMEDMTGDAYASWADDDSVVLNWVAAVSYTHLTLPTKA